MANIKKTIQTVQTSSVTISTYLCSVGVEITNELIPDIVVVCCGGGGLLSGVAAAIKTHSECKHTRVYGVEPETG